MEIKHICENIFVFVLFVTLQCFWFCKMREVKKQR